MKKLFLLILFATSFSACNKQEAVKTNKSSSEIQYTTLVENYSKDDILSAIDSAIKKEAFSEDSFNYHLWLTDNLSLEFKHNEFSTLKYITIYGFSFKNDRLNRIDIEDVFNEEEVSSLKDKLTGPANKLNERRLKSNRNEKLNRIFKEINSK